ncbi:MAG: DNA mismatch repair endonuclease MutL [Planctomycetaceae bacterium]
MSRIRQLDPTVINKIAAGEVIERPASVVKELLENSIDALATRIEVDIEEGGSELIRVADNGCGIHPDDLLLSVTSHATSKIADDADLFRVHTMGFRGEALASISSVSRFTVRSRQEDAAAGVELTVAGGQPAAAKECGCPVGTIIEVRQLFFNTPVRRKFLKRVSTEFGHISEQFVRIAIANPRLHMVLRHNGKIVYEQPASAGLAERLRLFYGDELADKLIEVESETGEGENLVRLWGFVAHPSYSKSTRKSQYLFLNGRWIQDKSLQHALGEAYRGLLMVGRFPVCFLFLEMAPDQVDVNVHPTKMEVRFRDSQQLYRQMLNTLRKQFLSMELESELEISRVVPSNPGSELRLEGKASPTFRQTRLPEPEPMRTPPTVSPVLASPTSTPSGGGGANGGTTAVMPSSEQLRRDMASWANEATSSSTTMPASPQTTATGDGKVESGSSSEPQSETPAAEILSDQADANRAFQLHDCYIVVATDTGLTVIDQHALHERILYEQFREKTLAGSVEKQKLLMPEAIELSPKEAALVLEQKDLLYELGFEVGEFGGSTVLISAYPAMLKNRKVARIVRDLAEHLDNQDGKPTRRDLLDSLLHMMACKAAIKAGYRLSREEIEALLEQRHLCDDAHHCPHGRPTWLTLSQATLDKQFGRLG